MWKNSAIVNIIRGDKMKKYEPWITDNESHAYLATTIFSTLSRRFQNNDIGMQLGRGTHDSS